jgi:hypothetical protein
MEEEGRGHNFVQNFTHEMKGESDDAFLYPVEASGIRLQLLASDISPQTYPQDENNC